jgi:adenine phosphoribosyltransferase
MTSFEDLKQHVRDIPDYPKPGVIFRDITPILADPNLFARMIYAMQHELFMMTDKNVEIFASPESRGFIIAAAMAMHMKAGFVPMRKPGKLPAATLSCAYDLEYGSTELHVHTDGIKPGQNVVILDDVLATGGTLIAAAKLVQQAGGNLLGCVVLVDLLGLGGRKKVESAGYNIRTVLQY